MVIFKLEAGQERKSGSANGNRTRISALKGFCVPAQIVNVYDGFRQVDAKIVIVIVIGVDLRCI
jgi:hypothetical protein